MSNLTRANVRSFNWATHAGKAHADDIMCVVMLMSLGVDHVTRLKRTESTEGYELFDMGGGKYDHHQIGSEVRENGVPYAAFGLLYRELGEQFINWLGFDSAVAKRFEEEFVQMIDAHDNGRDVSNMRYTFMIQTIERFNSIGIETTHDSIILLLDSICNELKGLNESDRIIDTRLKMLLPNDTVLVLYEGISWKRKLIEYNDNRPKGYARINHVIFPNDHGQFVLQSVQYKYNSFECIKFPEEWVTDLPEGCAFCHKERFLAAFVTIEDAIRAQATL